MVPLIIIYNHRFDDNIEKLENIYRGKFSTIFHLVPFYDGSLPNVIPVFEQPFYFQGYIPQAIRILKDIKCSHYFFVSDDLLLHPSINENNILSQLNINENEGFLPWTWGMLSNIPMEWANLFPAINAFYSEDHLLHHAPDWKSQLPKREIAVQQFEKYGFKTGKLNLKYLKGEQGNYQYPRFTITLKEYIKLQLKKRRTLPYPLLAGYSDMFIVSKNNLNQFASYCELFRQMRLWVEVAIPTAMILSHQKVKFEKDTNWNGSTYWDNINLKEMEERFSKVHFDLNTLLNDYKKNELYIHPIKLSIWKL